MSDSNRLLLSTASLTQVVILGFTFSILSTSRATKSEAVLYSLKPEGIRRYNIPHRYYGIEYLNSDPHTFIKERKSTYRRNPAPLPVDKVFQIEPSDAIDGIKYSQPDIAYSLVNFKAGAKVPSTFKQQLSRVVQNNNNKNFNDRVVSAYELSNQNVMKHLRDIRYLDSTDEKVQINTDDSETKSANNFKHGLQTDSYDRNTTDLYVQNKRNFTDASENLVSVSSDTVLTYVPSDINYDSENTSVKQHSDIVNDMPSLNSSNFNESISYPPNTDYTSDTVTINTRIDIVNQTNFTDITVISTSVFPSINIEENVTNSLPSIDSEKKLSSGTVAGIVIVVLISVTLLSSAVIYLLYRKFNGRCTSVVESKFTTDNCGYLDDSLRSSIYLNNHIELPKESSEEMTSLDNDSFLNSLETMTIQNYWADNSKNTKV